jgi:hypothetical protein
MTRARVRKPREPKDPPSKTEGGAPSYKQYIWCQDAAEIGLKPARCVVGIGGERLAALQEFAEEHVEVVHAVLTLHGVAAAVVG